MSVALRCGREYYCVCLSLSGVAKVWLSVAGCSETKLRSVVTHGGCDELWQGTSGCRSRVEVWQGTLGCRYRVEVWQGVYLRL